MTEPLELTDSRALSALFYLLTDSFGYLPRNWRPDPAAAARLTSAQIRGPNIGKKTLDKITLWLRTHGYRLADYVPPEDPLEKAPRKLLGATAIHLVEHYGHWTRDQAVTETRVALLLAYEMGMRRGVAKEQVRAAAAAKESSPLTRC